MAGAVLHASSALLGAAAPSCTLSLAGDAVRISGISLSVSVIFAVSGERTKADRLAVYMPFGPLDAEPCASLLSCITSSPAASDHAGGGLPMQGTLPLHFPSSPLPWKRRFWAFPCPHVLHALPHVHSPLVAPPPHWHPSLRRRGTTSGCPPTLCWDLVAW